MPEWASIDVETGDIYLGADEADGTSIKLDNIHNKVYERAKNEETLLLIQIV